MVGVKEAFEACGAAKSSKNKAAHRSAVIVFSCERKLNISLGYTIKRHE